MVSVGLPDLLVVLLGLEVEEPAEGCLVARFPSCGKLFHCHTIGSLIGSLLEHELRYHSEKVHELP